MAKTTTSVIVTPTPEGVLHLEASGDNAGASFGKLLLRRLGSASEGSVTKKDLEYFRGVADASWLRDATDFYQMLEKYGKVRLTVCVETEQE